ncbi:MAG: hypothetical protein H0T86_05280 [Gemmatimonadales bacterium]|nr:hypothetical protein [Gemmatimonadales bacterium]
MAGQRIGILLHRSRAEIDVTLKVDVDKERLFDELRREFSAIPGSSVTIGQPIGHRIDHSRAVNVMLPQGQLTLVTLNPLKFESGLSDEGRAIPGSLLSVALERGPMR